MVSSNDMNYGDIWQQSAFIAVGNFNMLK